MLIVLFFSLSPCIRLDALQHFPLPQFSYTTPQRAGTRSTFSTNGEFAGTSSPQLDHTSNINDIGGGSINPNRAKPRALFVSKDGSPVLTWNEIEQINMNDLNNALGSFNPGQQLKGRQKKNNRRKGRASAAQRGSGYGRAAGAGAGYGRQSAAAAAGAAGAAPSASRNNKKLLSYKMGGTNSTTTTAQQQQQSPLQKKRTLKKNNSSYNSSSSRRKGNSPEPIPPTKSSGRRVKFANS